MTKIQTQIKNIPNLKVCSNCVMDSSDPALEFNHEGVCANCLNFFSNVKPNWPARLNGREKLQKIVNKIKSDQANKDFDCLLGMSGGLDSSYMLHELVVNFGLRPLVYHIDGGWNSEEAVHNIQVIVKKLGLDLYTEVINWPEMRDFQLAYFKSGVAHIDTPQDHAFIASLYHFANKTNTKYIMNGSNISTEGTRNPLSWGYFGTDMLHIKDIQDQFCTRELNTYPFSSILFHKVYLRYFKNVKVLKPLNYINYTKEKAIDILSKTYGWKSFPQKHFESRFTKFYEGYWMPTRFGIDFRKTQFSSLILTNQMTRNDAIEQLKKPAFDPKKIVDEFDYIADKLNITRKELYHYHQMPLKTFRDYKNRYWMFFLGSRILNLLGIERAIKK